MGKKKSSSRAWLKEHHDDVYVQRAQKEGYRSRAVYKLMEINEKDRIIRSGMSVLDLGSAPGGWSQVAGEWVGAHGRVQLLRHGHAPRSDASNLLLARTRRTIRAGASMPAPQNAAAARAEPRVLPSRLARASSARQAGN